jgi:hypothetical protein
MSIEVKNYVAHYCLVKVEVDENLWYYDIK